MSIRAAALVLLTAFSATQALPSESSFHASRRCSFRVVNLGQTAAEVAAQNDRLSADGWPI